MTDEMDKTIQDIQNQFFLYLKDPENFRMPDMAEYERLKIKRRKLNE